MVTTGILLGLLAATCQSSSYICSKIFSERHPNLTLEFLLYTHFQMFLVSSIITVYYWPSHLPPLEDYAIDFLLMVFPYFVAQSLLIFILKTHPASKISPLLALKIIILICISMVFMDKTYSTPQWLAFAMVIGAAFLLNKISGGIGLKHIFLIFFACIGYSLSDIYIEKVVSHFSYMGEIKGKVFTTSLCYTFLGFVVIPILPFVKRLSKKEFVDAIPFSCAWLLAMMFLFSSFGLIGAVYGNIVQSTRGVISILIGSIIAWKGYVHLENTTNFKVFFKRIFAALLITLAIIVFNLYKMDVLPIAEIKH